MTPADEGVSPTLDAADLVAAVPGLSEVGAIEAVSFRRIPGPHLTVDDILELGRFIQRELTRDEVAGAVITQGTDTIEETAFLLDLVLEAENPVIVTGAMRNPMSLSPDGAANLYASARVAASPSARGMGVLVVLNDEIHSARFVQKTHTASPSAFASVNGPLGWITEGEPRLLTRPNQKIRLPARPDGPHRPVALLTASLDDDGRILAALPGLGFEGVVVEGTGGGHVPEHLAEKVDQVVAEMPVVFASRVGRGEVLRETYGFLGAEIDLQRRGAIPAGWLDGPKARSLLALLLRCDASRDSIAEVFAALTASGPVET